MNLPKELRTSPGVSTVLVCLSAAMALSVCGCRKQAATELPPPIVEVAELVPTDMPMSTEIIGQLDSPQNVEIRARVEAFVDKVLFVEGTEVSQGDPLFKLDDKPFQERFAAAKASLAEAKAALGKSEKDVERLTPLAEKRAVPQQDLDNAKASVDVGEANVLSAEASVEFADLNVGYCDVRAPISGLIGAKQVSIGDLVGKGQPTLLATISTLNPMWFYCSVSEVDYLQAENEVKKTGRRVRDLPVTLLLANGAEHPEKGKFVFVDRAVDVKTGTLRLRVEFPNSAKVLRPGMFGRIRVDLGVRPNSLLVPEKAVVELQGKSFVWVIGQDNKATQRPVTVSGQHGENLLITEGLKPGERIVVEGLQKVREGGPVKPMTAQELAQAASARNASANSSKE